MAGSERGSGSGSASASVTNETGRGPAPTPTAKARGLQTRRRIAEAAIALLEEKDYPPTTKEIAARAAVSHRLLFHHFKDLEALLGMVAALQFERYREAIAEVPPHLPLGQRVERTVRNRTELYESLGHLGSNVVALSGRLQSVADGVADAHEMLRARLEHTFADELKAAGRRGRERLGAVDTAVSWHVWDYLQRVNRLSPSATRRVMRTLLVAAVSDC